MKSILFVFLDGFGLGKANCNNPFFTYGLPGFEKKIKCKLLDSVFTEEESVLVKGIDACLGVKGIPQSATGQTALFTGINAPALLGFHLPAFPNKQLIEVIHSHSILKKVTDNGLKATFANAYSDSYFEKVAQGKLTHSVTTHCVIAAGIPFRTIDDLLKNRAVYWDINRSHLLPSTTTISPENAGQHLSSIAAQNTLTLFESFTSDIVGHSTSMEKAVDLLKLIDEFLCGILDTIHQDTTFILSSDHGNIEDLSTGSHTENAVPLIVLGPSARLFSNISSIDQITPAILDYLLS